MRFKSSGFAALLGILSLATFIATSAHAEFRTSTYYAGPRVWFGNLNGAVAVGGQIERGFTEPGDAGPGIITGGLGVDWYSWDNEFPGFGSYEYTVIPIQFFSNYHFIVDSDRRIDPYAGLAIVYQSVSASWSGPGDSGFSASGSETDLAGQAGIRYFLKDNFALQGQIGFGYGTIALGVTWRL